MSKDILSWHADDYETDGEREASFDKFMNVFMWILSISIIVLLIFIISSYFKRKKENLNNTGEVLIIGSHIISIIGFAFMGMATILSPLSIVGGFMLLSKSN